MATERALNVQATSMSKCVSVDFAVQARAVRETLDAQEKRRLHAIIQVLKHAPRDGYVSAPPSDAGEPLRQMTGGTMHITYRAKIVPLGWRLQIVLIEVRDWHMLEDGEIRTPPR